MKKLVSVIIPTYKRSPYLTRAVDSVLKQSYENIEIIIVDDNGLGTKEQISTQNTIIENYGNRRNVLYYPMEVNSGVCAARNLGISNANGEIVAFLDDDDEYLEDYISLMIDVMQKKNVDMVYSGKNFQGKCGHVYAYKKDKMIYPEGFIHNEALRGDCPISVMFCVKKDIMLKAGGFNGNLNRFGDYDVWLRLTRIAKCAVQPKPAAVIYSDDEERMSMNPEKRLEALNFIVDEWNHILNEKEIQDIEMFREKQKKYLLERRLLKERYNGKKVDMNEIKECKNSMNSLRQRVGFDLNYLTKMKYEIMRDKWKIKIFSFRYIIIDGRE